MHRSNYLLFFLPLLFLPISLGFTGPWDFPITSTAAPSPKQYTSTRLTSVPGFFHIESYPTTAPGLLDMHFDRNNLVTIHPSLYSPPNPHGNRNIDFAEAWANLKEKLIVMNGGKSTNSTSARGIKGRSNGIEFKYKLVFLARHGQGYHNAAQDFYGDHAWECYWATQSGNATNTWGPDAKLTPRGKMESEQTAAAWRTQLANGSPIPETHFVSPLSRSIETMEITWGGIYGWDDPEGAAVRPVMKELLRETVGLHASDQRSDLMTLHSAHPALIFAPLPTTSTGGVTTVPFPNSDPLWSFHRESLAMRDLRVQTALQDILTNDAKNSLAVSITAHWGVIQSALRVLGYDGIVNVGTAGVVPLVVRVDRNAVQGGGGWYEAFKTENKGKLEERSVCPGYPKIKIQGSYIVPGAVGM